MNTKLPVMLQLSNVNEEDISKRENIVSEWHTLDMRIVSKINASYTTVTVQQYTANSAQRNYLTHVCITWQ